MRHVTLIFVLCIAACGGNPYGYAPEYAPYGDEDDYFERAQQPSYEDVRRNPAEYTETLLGWFAVVQKVEPGEGAGQYRVTLDLRFLQPRNLCTGEFDSGCRVTVSDKSGGPFTALIALRPEDQSGKYRLGPESLVKVYGKALPDFDAQGGPLVRAEYYRHWPPGTYVSTARRHNMRK